MTTTQATLLGFNVTFSNVPQNTQELQVMQKSASEDETFITLIKPYMAAKTYTETRAAIIDAIVKGTGIPRKDLSEANYMNKVRKEIFQQILPQQEVPYTEDEIAEGKNLVEVKLVELAGATLNFDFQAWESTPSERGFGGGPRKPGKVFVEAAESYLAFIRAGTKSFEGFNTEMAKFGIASVEDGESIVTDMARALQARTAALSASEF